MLLLPGCLSVRGPGAWSSLKSVWEASGEKRSESKGLCQGFNEKVPTKGEGGKNRENRSKALPTLEKRRAEGCCLLPSPSAASRCWEQAGGWSHSLEELLPGGCAEVCLAHGSPESHIGCQHPLSWHQPQDGLWLAQLRGAGRSPRSPVVGDVPEQAMRSLQSESGARDWVPYHPRGLAATGSSHCWHPTDKGANGTGSRSPPTQPYA